MSYTPGTSSADASDQHPGALQSTSVDTSTSVRTAITATASGTPHATGTYTQISASLPAAASGIVFTLTSSTFASATNTSTLLEIGTGAGGSEVAWASIGVGYQVGAIASGNGPMFWIPGAIASGTRVAVRVRSAVASQAVTGVYSFLPAKSTALAAPTTYQADTSTSRGLTITAPGSLNTKGAWTELVSSTAAEFNALALYPQFAGGSTMSSTGLLVDIGIGAAASETVLVPDVFVLATSTEFCAIRSPNCYGVDIPSGSRLSARYARANSGNALDLVVVCA